MAATKWNQDLNAGENWWADINLKNAAGANRPIPNHTLASCIKRHYKAVNTKEAMKLEVLNAASGQIKLSLTATQTSNLKFGKWLYDVELTDQRGSVVTITGDGIHIMSGKQITFGDGTTMSTAPTTPADNSVTMAIALG